MNIDKLYFEFGTNYGLEYLNDDSLGLFTEDEIEEALEHYSTEGYYLSNMVNGNRIHHLDFLGDECNIEEVLLFIHFRDQILEWYPSNYNFLFGDLEVNRNEFSIDVWEIRDGFTLTWLKKDLINKLNQDLVYLYYKQKVIIPLMHEPHCPKYLLEE